MEHFIINKDNLMYGSVEEALNLGKLKSTAKKEEFNVPKVPIVAMNYKQAYTKWYYTWILDRVNKNKIEDLTMRFAKIFYTEFKKVPEHFMSIDGTEFNREYNLRHYTYFKDATFILCPVDCVPDKDVVPFKEYLRVRYFTDVVDNAVRIEMYDHKNYVPKPYIDMNNIIAAQKYLDSMNESSISIDNNQVMSHITEPDTDFNNILESVDFFDDF